MRLTAAFALAAFAAFGAEEGQIMRPADRAAFDSGEIDVAARAPNGRLELDGSPVTHVEEPFPDVFHAKIDAGPGEHKLALLWEGGRREISFYVGANPPAGYASFRQHPPIAEVACTQCHGLSRRGRFRFKGGCFDCHVKDQFTAAHPHPVHVLEQCGMCHNAHGSTAAAHLLYPKETACQLCHGL